MDTPGIWEASGFVIPSFTGVVVPFFAGPLTGEEDPTAFCKY